MGSTTLFSRHASQPWQQIDNFDGSIEHDEESKLIMLPPSKRVVGQHRLDTLLRSQILKESRRASAFLFPRAASRAVCTAAKRRTAEEFRAGIAGDLAP